MLDESICHLRGVWSVLWLLFYFRWKILLANNIDPDQMPHYVVSDLGLQCLHMTTDFKVKMSLTGYYFNIVAFIFLSCRQLPATSMQVLTFTLLHS